MKKATETPADADAMKCPEEMTAEECQKAQEEAGQAAPAEEPAEKKPSGGSG